MMLVLLSCTWMAGVYSGSIISLPLGAPLLGLLILPLVFLFPQHRKVLLLTILCLIAFFGGGLRFQSSLPAIDKHYLAYYNDQGIAEIEGMVDADPETRDRAVLLRLASQKIRVEGEWNPVSGIALLRVPRFLDYSYGDILKVTGRLETPPQLGDFDYQGYLARQGICSTMFYPKVEVGERGKGLKPLAWVYSLRDRLSQALTAVLPEPQGSLAQGILLGLRSDIPSSLREAFSRTGTAHLLAISGLHIGVVAGILFSAGIWLWGRQRSLYIWLAFAGIWLYALLSGMRPPVVRAVIMGSVFLLAEHLGRQRSVLPALTLAAAVMVGIRPQVLWDVAFQLSFLAMAGLVFVTPYFRSWGRGLVVALMGEWRVGVSLAKNLVDALAVTMGAILATLPLIAYNFGIVSLVGLPAAVFALPALPAIVVTTALAGGVGIMAVGPAQVLGWVAWLFLTYLMGVVQVFDALPSSSVTLTSFPASLVWSYYILLGVAIWGASNRSVLGSLWSKIVATWEWLRVGVSRLPLRWVLPPLVVGGILVWTAALSMPDDRLHVSFLDVGQGDAILIQTPTHQDILIDGGPSPQAVSLELGEKMPFWDRTIDLLVLTHPQDDHLTGLVEVLRRYKVGQVLEPEFEYETPAYEEWLQIIEEQNIKRTIAQAGQQFELGEGTRMEVFHPGEQFLEGTESDVNNNSIVLRLVKDEVSFLLTGDIQEEAEGELIIRRARLKSTVLKVAHHGSDTSTSSRFLAAVDPWAAVILVGEDNPFGHPRSEIVERLRERLGKDRVYLTSKRGTIEFITDGERLWVRTERQ